MPRAVISGYYGFGNCGDDAILRGIISGLRQQDADLEVVVLSANPAETRNRLGVAAVNRYNPVAVARAIAGADLLISGGGSLLQDITSTRSLLYYLSVIQMALSMGKRVMLYANGIGPITRATNRQLCRRVLCRVHLITVRDDSSREELESLGVRGPLIEVTADPVFALDELGTQEPPETEVTVGAAFRPWGPPDRLQWVFSVLASTLTRRGWRIRLIPMHWKEDHPLAARLRTAAPGGVEVWTGPLAEPADLRAAFSGLSVMVGMRLHALMFAVKMGIPVVGLAYDPKVTAFLRSVGQEQLAESLDSVDPQRLCEAVSGAVRSGPELRARVREHAAQLAARARRNAELAVALLRGEMVGDPR